MHNHFALLHGGTHDRPNLVHNNFNSYLTFNQKNSSNLKDIDILVAMTLPLGGCHVLLYQKLGH